MLPLALFGAGACTATPPDDSAVVVRQEQAAPTPPADPPLPPARDTAATLAELARRTAAIDADTATMSRSSHPIDLGAGTTGVLHAWRAGPVWRRLRLEGDGDGFTTIETYWLGTAGPLKARQETVRPGETPRIETIWFRDSLPYRWLDADGRTLTLQSRSTEYQADGLRTRLADLMQVVIDTGTAQPPPDR